MGLAAAVGVSGKSNRKHMGYLQTAKFEQGSRHLAMSLLRGGTDKFVPLGSVCRCKTHVLVYNSH